MRGIEKIKVSIIVPVYNVEKYLDQCIQSLIHQTYQNIEIILVDDGSSDHSPAICKKYCVKDSRVLFISQANQGVSAARNTGLRHAVGEWISFVDGDDWAATDMLSSLLTNAEGQDIVIGDAYTYENGKTKEFSFFDTRISVEKRTDFTYLVGNALGCRIYCTTGPNIGVPWARIYRRNFLAQNHIQFTVGIKRMQDMIMNIDAFSCSPKIGYCNKPIYFYRITKGSASNRYNPQFEDTAKSILRCITDVVGKSPVPKIRELYVFKAVSLLWETLSLNYWHPECKLSEKEKITGTKRVCEIPDNAAALRLLNYALFSPKYRILLWLLAHRFYGTAYCIFALRRKMKELRTTDNRDS